MRSCCRHFAIAAQLAGPNTMQCALQIKFYGQVVKNLSKYFPQRRRVKNVQNQDVAHKPSAVTRKGLGSASLTDMLYCMHLANLKVTIELSVSMQL